MQLFQEGKQFLWVQIIIQECCDILDVVSKLWYFNIRHEDSEKKELFYFFNLNFLWALWAMQPECIFT